jgi:hypothetical protein
VKIVCDCGNEAIFNTIDEETGEERKSIEDEGQYVTIEGFRFWQTQDVVGIVCEKCGKDIWLFT